MIPTLLVLTLFANQYDCMRKMDMDIVNRPKDATFTYVDKTAVMVNLYGASAILKCTDNKYTVHVAEGIRLSDFPL